MAKGDLELLGAHLTVKYVNNGPYFFSPGAQTNRYTPATGTAGYLNSNQSLDHGLPGYLDGYVYQGVSRPSFAPFDRLSENILPYGDGTPNRAGFVFGFSGAFGR